MISIKIIAKRFKSPMILNNRNGKDATDYRKGTDRIQRCQFSGVAATLGPSLQQRIGVGRHRPDLGLDGNAAGIRHQGAVQTQSAASAADFRVRIEALDGVEAGQVAPKQTAAQLRTVVLGVDHRRLAIQMPWKIKFFNFFKLSNFELKF